MMCIKQMNNYDLIIIGAGPAGMMAAICAKTQNPNIKIVVFDKNNRAGKKLSITGKGRCNITNASEIDNLMSNIPRNSRFLYSAFNAFSPQDLMSFFENSGVPLKIERGNRVFPTSDKSSDIVNALEKQMLESADFITAKVDKIVFENGFVKGVRTMGRVFYAEKVVLATGGNSYSGTGSNGDGYRLASATGHQITSIEPSLVGLESDENFIKDLAGLSLINIDLKLKNNKNKLIFCDRGEMIFTHKGISGPLVLSASAFINENDSYYCEIDLKPALDEIKLDKRIQRDFAEFANKNFANSLGKLLPESVVPVIIKLSGIAEDKKVNSITREERVKLVRILKNLRINITQKRPINEAIITRGGISIKEINPKTMESKLIKNLYFAGEIIDVDALTGGYNLQIAFSTAYLAGINCANE